MTINEELVNEAIGHAIDLQHYANDTVRRVVGLLNGIDPSLFSGITSMLENMPLDADPAQYINEAIHQVAQINAKAYAVVGDELNREVELLSQYEAQYQASVFNGLLPQGVDVAPVTWQAIQDAALGTPFQGRLLEEWAMSMEVARLNRIHDAINIGFVQGQTTDEIVRTIRGTRAAAYADGIIQTDRRSAEAVTRTAISHITATARQSMYDANSDLIDSQMWVSTLDDRTTFQCMIRDGLEYTLDGEPIGHIIPWLDGPGELHWNCRSVSVPVVKSWKDLGLNIDEVSAGTRASMDGQVPSDMTYGDWLSQQSADRQDQVLGPTRGAELRSGTPFTRFFNDKGRFLTLVELASRTLSGD